MKKIIERIGRLYNWLCYTGLWVPVPLTAGAVGLFSYLNPQQIWSIEQVVFTFGLAHAASLHVWSQNRIAKMNGLQKFPLILWNTRTNPYYQFSYRQQALNRAPDKRLLQDKPSGIVLGKSGKQYVCVKPTDTRVGATHTLVLGGTGSGKTSSVLASVLLTAQMKRNKKNAPVFVLVDVKGELEEKFFSTNTSASNLAVFNPQSRDGWGFDFLYDINEDSCEVEVLGALRRVVYSLLPLNQNITDKFWVLGPRNVLLGLFLFGWQNRGLRNLPDLVDFALSKELQTLINEVIAEVDEYSIVNKLLVSFSGEEGAPETISGIAMNLSNALSLIATDETLRYLLREAPQKITPAMLEEGVSIDMQISDAYLKVYASILSLAIGTCCDFLNNRKEGNNRQVIFLLDELGRIAKESGGPIEGLQQTLQIGRSRSVTMMLCLQSWEAMRGAYTESDCIEMLSNLPYRVILQAQADSKETVEMCIKAFGKYTEKKRSLSTGKNGSYTYSFEEKDMLMPDDLLLLPERQKVAVLTPYGAFLLDKCQYFSDRNLKKVQEKIKK